MPTRYFGLLPDRFDERDLLLHQHVSLPLAAALPPSVDLRATGALADPIFDQGELGSCTANAIAAALMYAQRAQRLLQHVTPARLALYYWERVIEGSTSEDAGAELRDGLKVVAGKPGYVDETEWPYDVARFADDPGPAVAVDAAKDHATKYMRVSVNATAMKQALAAGFPVVVGFDVYGPIQSDEVAQTGVLPMPTPGEQAVGGHAVLLVGYDDAARTWLCRNSWGDGWGQGGYFTVPYGYLDSAAFATDFWTIQLVAEGSSPTPPAPPTPTDPLHELAAVLRQFATNITSWLSSHDL
jgi:C1A family cysteine protease